MRTAFLAATALLATFVSPADAQRALPIPPKAVVAYVSGNRLSTESDEGKAAQVRLQLMRQEKATELRTRQQALDATRLQIAALVGASQERTDLQQREQQQRTDLERATAQAQTDLQNLQRQMASDIQPKIRSALDDLLKGTDIQVVLQMETTIVWTAPGLDLTSAVIERMNASGNAPAGVGGGVAR